MAEPKKKLSGSRSKSRKKANAKKQSITLVICPKCKQKIRAHRVCKFCGYYKEKTIVKK